MPTSSTVSSHLKQYVPADNDALAAKYEAIGGTCGPAAIAVLEHYSGKHGATVQEVLNSWCGKDEKAFKGYSPIREMKQTLSFLGYEFKYVRGHKARVSEYYWAAAGAHTHYLFLQKIDVFQDGAPVWLVFCNGNYWFEPKSKLSQRMFEVGYVSSYLEIVKKNWLFQAGDDCFNPGFSKWTEPK